MELASDPVSLRIGGDITYGKGDRGVYQYSESCDRHVCSFNRTCEPTLTGMSEVEALPI